MRAWLALALCVIAAPAGAEPSCPERLGELHVAWKPAAPHRGIDTPVEVDGPLGGVSYRFLGGAAHPLVLDCSLVYSLARAGRYLSEAGLNEALYTDAYDVRNIKGTSRPSKHSFGLALDVHEWRGPAGTLSIEDDYEEGLGEGRDCVGRPDNERAGALRLLFCRFERSQLFRIILGPDFDEDHRNHFHMEALPWKVREDLAPP